MVTIKALSAYILTAMTAWVPINQHAYYEKEEETTTRYENIATDIAQVALNPSEPPLFAGDPDVARVKTALLVTSFASLESSFKASVDDGRERGDHGTAWCLMQIRPALGLFLEGTGYDFAVHRPKQWRVENADRILKGTDLIATRTTCLIVGLHMLRQDKIYGYTGEGKGGKKAEHRLNRAKKWYAEHPFPVVEDEVDEHTSENRD